MSIKTLGMGYFTINNALELIISNKYFESSDCSCLSIKYTLING